MNPQSYVYYLSDPFHEYVKIGVTTRLARRMSAFKNANLHAYLVAAEPGDSALEKQRHEQFRAYWVGYEWFERAGSLKAHINSLTQCQVSIDGVEFGPCARWPFGSRTLVQEHPVK